jgi:hypothetical protein
MTSAKNRRDQAAGFAAVEECRISNPSGGSMGTRDTHFTALDLEPILLDRNFIQFEKLVVVSVESTDLAFLIVGKAWRGSVARSLETLKMSRVRTIFFNWLKTRGLRLASSRLRN